MIDVIDSLLNALIWGVGIAIGTAIGNIILDRMKNNSQTLKKVLDKKKKG